MGHWCSPDNLAIDADVGSVDVAENAHWNLMSYAGKRRECEHPLARLDVGQIGTVCCMFWKCRLGSNDVPRHARRLADEANWNRERSLPNITAIHGDAGSGRRGCDPYVYNVLEASEHKVDLPWGRSILGRLVPQLLSLAFMFVGRDADCMDGVTIPRHLLSVRSLARLGAVNENTCARRLGSNNDGSAETAHRAR